MDANKPEYREGMLERANAALAATRRRGEVVVDEGDFLARAVEQEAMDVAGGRTDVADGR